MIFYPKRSKITGFYDLNCDRDHKFLRASNAMSNARGFHSGLFLSDKKSRPDLYFVVLESSMPDVKLGLGTGKLRVYYYNMFGPYSPDIVV